MKTSLHALLGLLGLGLLGGAVWWVSPGNEPMYQGKALSHWLENHIPHVVSVGPRPGSPEWSQADEALRTIGTNAIPALLEMIQATDPALLSGRLAGWKRLRIARPASQRNREAVYAFEVMGSNAIGAVPELIRICQKPPSDGALESAVQALGRIGPGAGAAIPVLISLFTNRVAGDAIAAVLAIGDSPSAVEPLLHDAVTNLNPLVRGFAVSALQTSAMEGRYRADPGMLARALSLTLNSREGGIMSVHALASLGRTGSESVPLLVDQLDRAMAIQSPDYREAIERALWLIAPELLGFLLVETPTPLVAGDLTAQVLEVSASGERTTLVPAGVRIPGVFPLKGMDGLGPFSLYRGPRLSSVDASFLGRFVIGGLAPSRGRTNVSIVCLVSERQIALGARDNDHRVPLEVHRID